MWTRKTDVFPTPLFLPRAVLVEVRGAFGARGRGESGRERSPGLDVLAEEVAQEAFVRAWRYADAYDPQRASVTTWLLRITRNLAIDALRRRRPVALGPETVTALTPPGPATVVEDATVTSELAAQARAALTRLAPGQAKAVWLAAFYGHSAQQVAVSGDSPSGQPKSA